jgi:hypothetical protein
MFAHSSELPKAAKRRAARAPRCPTDWQVPCTTYFAHGATQQEPASRKMAELTLHYWGGRGLAEVAR